LITDWFRRRRSDRPRICVSTGAKNKNKNIEEQTMSNIPGFDDKVLIRFTDEDIRVIKRYAEIDAEMLDVLEKGQKIKGGKLVTCRRECLIDINCILFAVSEEIKDKAEFRAILKTFRKIEPYEFG